jgi:serine-type D-Ala-D-Ala carboxypeptidase/endopeptidase (penicillin-binding protein 4)
VFSKASLCLHLKPKIAFGALAALGLGSVLFGCRAGSQAEKPCVPAEPNDSGASIDPAARAAEDRLAEGAEFQPEPGEQGAHAPQAGPGAPKVSPESGVDKAAWLLELDAWAKKRGGRARGFALDLESGAVLMRLESGVPVNPASTQKLLTAGAALSLLGPAYRFKTEVWLEPGEGSTVTSLELVGGGAPDLTMRDVAEWAEALRHQGISSVGAISVNQSLLVSSVWPPAYEEQPGEWAAFRAPISALALEKNALSLLVVPARESEPAHVWFSPPGLGTSSGGVTTGKSKSGDRVRWDLSLTKGSSSLSSVLGGSLAEDAGPQKYSRRVEDPRLGPGLALKEQLTMLGIRVPGAVTLSDSRSKAAKKWRVSRSASLATLVRELGKDSDNFSAEMLAVALSDADTEGPKGQAWSTERGIRVLKSWLTRIGLDPSRSTLRNGSGLFGANQVSPELLVGVLAHMARESGAAPEFESQLAIGGMDGTLRQRFGRAPWATRVRAKTGTLRDTDALAGYIYPSSGGLPIAFAIVVSGVNGEHGEARQRMDHVVEKLFQSGASKSERPKPEEPKVRAPEPPAP